MRPDLGSARHRSAVVETALTVKQAVRRYDRLSWIYELNAILGSSTSQEAIAGAALHPGDFVLELGVGTGRDLVQLAQRVGCTGRAVGVDLAVGMLRRARRRIVAAGHLPQGELLRADARHIPLAENTVDVVFCSRVLDLTETPQIPVILTECRRVLRPLGQIVLVNMSKRGPATSWFEHLYTSVIGFGGQLFVSRPVLAAPVLQDLGFHQVRRVYRRDFPTGTEIAWAQKPGPQTGAH